LNCLEVVKNTFGIILEKWFDFVGEVDFSYTSLKRTQSKIINILRLYSLSYYCSCEKIFHSRENIVENELTHDMFSLK